MVGDNHLLQVQATHPGVDPCSIVRHLSNFVFNADRFFRFNYSALN